MTVIERWIAGYFVCKLSLSEEEQVHMVSMMADISLKRDKKSNGDYMIALPGG